jgi:hypothetical protein
VKAPRRRLPEAGSLSCSKTGGAAPPGGADARPGSRARLLKRKRWKLHKQHTNSGWRAIRDGHWWGAPRRRQPSWGKSGPLWAEGGQWGPQRRPVMTGKPWSVRRRHRVSACRIYPLPLHQPAHLLSQQSALRRGTFPILRTPWANETHRVCTRPILVARQQRFADRTSGEKTPGVRAKLTGVGSFSGCPTTDARHTHVDGIWDVRSARTVPVHLSPTQE